MIQHNKPLFDEYDHNAIIKALQSGYVAQGHEVDSFEKELALFVGVKDSCLVNSGTTALYLALYALNVGKDDEVILPTYVCSALLNAVYMIGGKPVLVDVNDEDFNISWKQVDDKINGNTKAIIVPHIHGMPSLLPGMTFNNIPIIEDCATALGSEVYLTGGVFYMLVPHRKSV